MEFAYAAAMGRPHPSKNRLGRDTLKGLATLYNRVGVVKRHIARFIHDHEDTKGPPLTTIQMSQTELATLAFHALMNYINREQLARGMNEYHLVTSLVLRQSTALAPRKTGHKLAPGRGGSVRSRQ